MKYISVLRGINVGGKRLLPMKDLKHILYDNGLKNITTYIQSGNLVFDSKITDSHQISKKIETLITKTYGYDVPVITIKKDEFKKLVIDNPFLLVKNIDLKTLYVTLLEAAPQVSNTIDFNEIDFGRDEAKLIGKTVYLKINGLTKDSKLTNNFIESKLKVKATTRNWNTILKLRSYLCD